MRKTISLLAVAIVALLASFSASADDSGKCGMNAEWKIYPSTNNKAFNTLEISGWGSMFDFGFSDGDYEMPKEWLRVNKIIINEGVINIGDNAFVGFRSLRSVSFPKTLKFIGNAAFLGCSNLMSVKLPESLIVIGESAFADCSKLNTVIFPNSLTHIGTLAFSGCI